MLPLRGQDTAKVRMQVSDSVHDTWLTTSTGLHWYPKDPEGSEYRIEDIAHALSMLCRFSGQCRKFYSVAEHSVRVASVVSRWGAEFGLWGLLHDASEAYLVDLPTPIKHLPEMAGYRDLERQTMQVIRSRFGLSGKEPSVIKAADLLVLRREAKTLGLLTKGWDVYHLPDVDVTVQMLSSSKAEQLFLGAYEVLTGSRFK
jgi:uncharacterized protein